MRGAVLVPQCHSSWNPAGNPFLREPCLEVRQGWPPTGPLTSQSLPVHSREQIKRLFFYEMLLSLKKKKFLYLAVSSLSCRSSLFFVGGELLAAACGIYFPDPRWILGALHGERRVLATGSAGKSLKCTRWNADPEHTDKDARGPSLGGGVCTLGRRLQGCAVGVSDLLQRPEGASVCLLLGLLAP